MKTLFRFFFLAATLSAAPIDGGSCNGGGTAAEFAALSEAKCEQFGWRFVLLPGNNTNPLLDLNQINITLFEGEVLGDFLDAEVTPLRIITTGYFPTGDFRIQFDPIVLKDRDRWFRRTFSTSGDESDIARNVLYDFRVATAGSYTIDQTYYFTAPEPGYAMLCGVCLLILHRARRANFS